MQHLYLFLYLLYFLMFDVNKILFYLFFTLRKNVIYLIIIIML